ncbi:LAFA_0C08130g1_1 [Lachancea sp. 'fantastica']|nr:LAFA_0C08130g1_1 [Lachancea sp. 'fantastica']
MFPIAIENGRHHSLPPLLLPDISRLSNAAAVAAAASATATATNAHHHHHHNHHVHHSAASATGGNNSTTTTVIPAHARAWLYGPPPPGTAGGVGENATFYRHHVPRLQPHPVVAGSGGLESLARLAVAHEEVPQKLRPLQPLAAPSAKADAEVVPMARSRSRNSPPDAETSGTKTAAALRGSKRQRAGPSCDTCRLKKIKCNAHIQTLWQHKSLIMFNGDRSESLHVELTMDEIRTHVLSLTQPYGHVHGAVRQHVDSVERDDSEDSSNPDSDFQQQQRGVLIRHVDKLILFKPCTSCAKTAAKGTCNFGKGYTRADIAVFTRLCRKLGTRAQLSDFSVTDYRDAGY